MSHIANIRIPRLPPKVEAKPAPFVKEVTSSVLGGDVQRRLRHVAAGVPHSPPPPPPKLPEPVAPLPTPAPPAPVPQKDEDEFSDFEFNDGKVTRPVEVTSQAPRPGTESAPLQEPPQNQALDSPISPTAEKPKVPSRKSLLIGCSYTSTFGKDESRESELSNSLRLFRDVAHEYLGFPTDPRAQKIYNEALGSTSAPTKKNIIAALKWLVDGVHDGDSLLIYYSGDCVMLHDNEEYIVPSEFDGDTWYRSLLSDREIADLLLPALRVKTKIFVVFDCPKAKPSLGLKFFAKTNGETLDVQQAPPGGSNLPSIAYCLSLHKHTERVSGKPDLKLHVDDYLKGLRCALSDAIFRMHMRTTGGWTTWTEVLQAVKKDVAALKKGNSSVKVEIAVTCSQQIKATDRTPFQHNNYLKFNRPKANFDEQEYMWMHCPEVIANAQSRRRLELAARARAAGVPYTPSTNEAFIPMYVPHHRQLKLDGEPFFEMVARDCASNNRKWIDPANPEIPSGVRAEWAFPKPGSTFFARSDRDLLPWDPQDIIQHGLRNSWYLASLACVARRYDLLMKFCSRRDERAGVFEFIFRRDEKEYPVLVDARIPMLGTGEPAFCKSDDNELWPIYAEKAYAKLVGGYTKTEGGCAAWGLEDLTGFKSLLHNFQEGTKLPDFNELGALLHKYYRAGHLMTASFRPAEKQQLLADGTILGTCGLHSSRAYTILYVANLNCAVAEGDKTLIRIYTCCAGTGEWKGRWGVDWSEWPKHPKVKEELSEIQDAHIGTEAHGSFWMSIQDFAKECAVLAVCTTPPPTRPSAATVQRIMDWSGASAATVKRVDREVREFETVSSRPM